MAGFYAIAGVWLLAVGVLVIGLLRQPRAASTASTSLVRMSVLSAVFCALTFNLTFFIQELFLVLPKALTPGLRPTLYHNNHHWRGEHPLAALFQGTGVAAILVTGVVSLSLLRLFERRSDELKFTVRLFLFWMAFQGCFQSLPQIVIGAMNPRSDIGMALGYLQASEPARIMVMTLALIAIPPLGYRLGRHLLALANESAQIADARARMTFTWQLATLPALVAIALILPFRVPRELIEVLLVPVIVIVTGLSWIQATAWMDSPIAGARVQTTVRILPAVIALLTLLAVFQFVLRPGIPFFVE